MFSFTSVYQNLLRKWFLLIIFLLYCCRFVVLPQPVCLEGGVSYKLRVEFIRYADRNSILTSTNAFVLVDSVSINLWFYSTDFFMFCLILTGSILPLTSLDCPSPSLLFSRDVYRGRPCLCCTEAELWALPLPRDCQECVPPTDEWSVC